MIIWMVPLWRAVAKKERKVPHHYEKVGHSKTRKMKSTTSQNKTNQGISFSTNSSNRYLKKEGKQVGLSLMRKSLKVRSWRKLLGLQEEIYLNLLRKFILELRYSIHRNALRHRWTWKYMCSPWKNNNHQT